MPADMELFLPYDAPLLAALANTQTRALVVCYCAAWCDTCEEYRRALQALAVRRTDVTFVWVDIEEYPELLDDEDVDNFPTILVERDGQPLFFGTMLPHIGQLERLVDALSEPDTPVFEENAPKDVRNKLLAGANQAAR